MSGNRLSRGVGSAVGLALVLAGGCASATPPLSPCTPAWYHWVERALSTGDGLGHGPDPGSLEWRAAIEFRLGLRGQPGRPALDSRVWCQDIDQRVANRL